MAFSILASCDIFVSVNLQVRTLDLSPQKSWMHSNRAHVSIEASPACRTLTRARNLAQAMCLRIATGCSATARDEYERALCLPGASKELPPVLDRVTLALAPLRVYDETKGQTLHSDRHRRTWSTRCFWILISRTGAGRYSETNDTDLVSRNFFTIAQTKCARWSD
jgi:hypothetical protein